MTTAQTNMRWGNWKYDRRTLVLRYEPQQYEIDLEACTTSAALLDRIFQVSPKLWMTPQDRSDLLVALEYLLHPQATLCSGGGDKKCDQTKRLREMNAA